MLLATWCVPCREIGIKLADLEQSQTRVAEIPFSSTRKMMVTVTKTLASSPLPHVAHAVGSTIT